MAGWSEQKKQRSESFHPTMLASYAMVVLMIVLVATGHHG